MDRLINIKSTQCGYLADSPVLHIDEFEINRGEIVFILGKSGSGKSTFLEAIGLMNNTFFPNYDTINYYENGKEVDISKLWDNEKAASQFRKNELSFIFQSTNLMSSFSSGENMAICAMLDGEKFDQIKPIVLQLMEELDLDESIFDKKIEYISGGQRQRLAFIRAMCAPYTILLGDEPTGNLDEGSARKAMSVLAQNIKAKKKAAVIVSHDISLALEYADHIYTVVKENEETVSEMSNNERLVNSNGTWQVNNTDIYDPYDYIKDKIR